jgi:transposase
MAAMSLARTEPALGAFYRRLADPVGQATAITAVARTLAILVDRTLKDGLVSHDPGAAAYDARHRQRVIRRSRQRAANLGFSLVDRGTGERLEGAVS